MDSKIVNSTLSLAYDDYIDARLLIRQNRLMNGGHLSSLAAEKLLKGLILACDRQPKHVHLDKADKLINQISEVIPSVQNHIDIDFLHYLGRIFSMRYYPESSDAQISISRNKLLWEIDRLFDKVHSIIKFEPNDLALYSKEKGLNNLLICEGNQWLLGKHKISELETYPDFLEVTYRFTIGMYFVIRKELPKTFINCKIGEEVKVTTKKK